MRQEKPRSPCSTPPIQCRYWIGNGRSSHSSERICASTCGSPRSSPASTSAGSPGMSCCKAKTRTLTSRIVGMTCSSLVVRWPRKLLRQAHALQPHHPVRYLLVALYLGRHADDALGKPEVHDG